VRESQIVNDPLDPKVRYLRFSGALGPIAKGGADAIWVHKEPDQAAKMCINDTQAAPTGTPLAS
jgi:hypothetical protein